MKFEKKIYVIGSLGMKAEFDKADLQYTGFGVCVTVEILFCLNFWRNTISHKDIYDIKGIFKPNNKENRGRERPEGQNVTLFWCLFS